MSVASGKQNGSRAILKGPIVDDDTTNKRGVSGLGHKVLRKSGLAAKHQHLTWTINCICVGASSDVEYFIPT